jgi:membrane protease YdiL (CAAX protease family)
MIRKATGEPRLVWRMILVILLFVGIEVLLRVIPIGLLTAIWVSSGMPRGSAAESARTLIFEDPVWSTVVGVLVGLLGFVIVWFMVRVVEKSRCTCRALGLDWRRSSPTAILLGVLLAMLLFIAYVAVGRLLRSSDASVSTLLAGVSTPVFFQKLLLFIAVGFGEEVVFRAYVQTRLSARWGAIWGALGTALTFTLLHQLSYNLSPVTILSGVVLWTTVGLLYDRSKSLYLVGAFHGSMNIMLNTLNAGVDDMAALVVHMIALLAIITSVHFRMKPRDSASSPMPGT